MKNIKLNSLRKFTVFKICFRMQMAAPEIFLQKVGAIEEKLNSAIRITEDTAFHPGIKEHQLSDLISVSQKASEPVKKLNPILPPNRIKGILDKSPPITHTYDTHKTRMRLAEFQMI